MAPNECRLVISAQGNGRSLIQQRLSLGFPALVHPFKWVARVLSGGNRGWRADDGGKGGLGGFWTLVMSGEGTISLGKLDVLFFLLGGEDGD